MNLKKKNVFNGQDPFQTIKNGASVDENQRPVEENSTTLIDWPHLSEENGGIRRAKMTHES